MPAAFGSGLGIPGKRSSQCFPGGVSVNQLNLMFEPGLGERYESLRECVAAQVYAAGHGRVAGQLDLSPSKLTEKLAGMDSGGATRGMTLDELETYIQKRGDVTPILYLAAKYCRDPKVVQAEALGALAALAERLPGLLSAAGLQPATASARRAR